MSFEILIPIGRPPCYVTETMRWGTPNLLLLLWTLPLIVLLVVYAQRKRQAAARRFASPLMLARLMPVTGARIYVKTTLLIVGIALVIVAAARPRFGAYFADVTSRGLDSFVLLDVSRSMQAEDVKPSRLERAKSDIKDLLVKLDGDRVGLIVFAGAPQIKVPLTTDQAFFRLVLDEVDAASAPRGGSLIGDAIRKGIEGLEPAPDRDQVLLLITDGEDQESYAEQAAQQAAERGIKIFTVGLGDSDEGARIPVRDEQGNLQYVKEKEGGEHWSALNENLLEKIALETGGAYIPAQTRDYDLGQIYEDHLAGLTRGELSTEKRKRYRERFQWFLALGLVFLLIDMLIPATSQQTPQWTLHRR